MTATDLELTPVQAAGADCADPACEPASRLPDALLEAESAARYAEWFATLSDATRVRLLHAVASAPRGSIKVGDLADVLGISQSTSSHHVRGSPRSASWSSTRSARRRTSR